MAHTTNHNTALSTYFDMGRQKQIRPYDINNSIKDTVIKLGLQQAGFTRTNVSSHSLRAGGAMAMKLNGIDPITIKKHGRWSSNTFLQYIHEQIGFLTLDVAARMSRYIPFTNVAHTHCHPQLTEPIDDTTDTPH